MANGLYNPNFQQQGLAAMQGGLALGNAMQQTKMRQQQMQQNAELQPLRKQLLESQIGSQDAAAKKRQDELDQMEFLSGMTMALSSSPDKQTELFQSLKRKHGNRSGVNEMMDSFIEAGPEDRIKGILGFLNKTSGGKGKAKTDSRTSEEKNMARLQQLVDEGKVAEAETFKKILNIEEDNDLSSKSEKAMIDAQDAYWEAGKMAREMEVLFQDLQNVKIGGGAKSSLSEMLKQFLGSEDDVSQLRRRYRAIRTSQATTNLPPGPASDKDIELALSGFPKENANKATILSFLRGAAKLSRINEKFNEFKAEYIGERNNTKGLLKAWKTYAKSDEFMDSILKSDDPISEAQQVPTVQDLLNKYGG